MKLRVGILGCANIARRSLIPAFASHPAFQVVAVASRTPGKAADVVTKYGCRTCTYAELISAADVDLIYCPVPTGLHCEWVKKSLVAGKHVLCEKSLGCNCAEVENMVQTARENHRFLMESFQFRFHAQNLYVKELLAKHTIGDIRHLLVRFGIPPFPEGVKNIRYHRELGGGALLDNGAYTIKCATYLLGFDIDVLSAIFGGNTASLGDVDLTGSIMMLAHPNPSSPAKQSANVCIQTSYGFDHFYQNGYELWGTEGKITTTRAFTAREDFAAPVVLETKNGREVKTFNDDHFIRLMDYLAKVIPSGDYEEEYKECLVQAKLLESVRLQSVKSHE